MRTLTTAALLASCVVATPGLATMKGAALAPLAKVSLAAARRAALAARPGTVIDEELEREKGGSGLRYSFDITSKSRKFEVGVDAKTGAILENGVEKKAD